MNIAKLKLIAVMQAGLLISNFCEEQVINNLSKDALKVTVFLNSENKDYSQGCKLKTLLLENKDNKDFELKTVLSAYGLANLNLEDELTFKEDFEKFSNSNMTEEDFLKKLEILLEKNSNEVAIVIV